MMHVMRNSRLIFDQFDSDTVQLTAEALCSQYCLLWTKWRIRETKKVRLKIKERFIPYKMTDKIDQILYDNLTKT